MSYRTDEPDTLVVKFAQWEGQQLLAFLDHSIARGDSRLDLGALLSALESLGDANSMARWLREDVAYELRFDEAAAVLEALDLGRECCEKCTSVSAALGGVAGTLKKTLRAGLGGTARNAPASLALNPAAGSFVVGSVAGVE
jgi:hypothetical protein